MNSSGKFGTCFAMCTVRRLTGQFDSLTGTRTQVTKNNQCDIAKSNENFLGDFFRFKYSFSVNSNSKF